MPDPLEIIQQEQEEFARMNDGIRDIDWHKAQTQAAQNGQEAAMKFAKAKDKEAMIANKIAETYKELLKEKEFLYRLGILSASVVALIIGILIGAWLF